MRSIVEEASSIAKAIEKAWNNAGKPGEFKVKVLELPEHGFLGMTKKPARVSLFFDAVGRASSEPSSHHRSRPERPDRDRSERGRGDQGRGRTERPRSDRDRSPVDRPANRPSMDRPPVEGRRAEPRRAERGNEQSAPRARDARRANDGEHEDWTPEMVAFAEQWLKEALSLLNLSQNTFSTKISGMNLRVDFAGDVDADRRKERLLFSSFAHMLMETVRNRFRKRLRSLKICISTPNNTQGE